MDRPYFYLGNGRGLTRLSTGEVFFVDTDGRDLSVWILLGGAWETFVDDILCALARPGDTFVDVGANMGYYTVKLASRVGEQGRIYAFEPNPVLHALARDNLNINGFSPRGLVVQAAAGAEAGTSTLTFTRSQPGGGMVGIPLEWSGPDHDRIEVQVVRIDDVVPADRRVDLIKIDVEGYEPLVFQGMQAVLARSPDAAIVTEVSHLQWSRFGDPATLLRAMAGDRRIFRIYTTGAIRELRPEDVEGALDRDFVSYVLLLPKNAARWEQVRRFEQGYETPTTAAAIPQPKRDILSRLRRGNVVGRIRWRLARMLQPPSL